VGGGHAHEAVASGGHDGVGAGLGDRVVGAGEGDAVDDDEAMELESANADDAYGDEPYTGPETVFVRVSDSGELLLESEGHPLENIKSESRSVAKSKATGNKNAARKAAAGTIRRK